MAAKVDDNVVVRLGGSEADHIELPHCTLFLVSPAPGLLATRVEGMGSLLLVEHIIAFGNSLMKGGTPIRIFHDFSRMTGYRTEARKLIVDWGVENRTLIVETHVLFRSKVVAMGVSLATSLLGNQLTGYSQRQPFEAVLQDAVLESRGAGA